MNATIPGIMKLLCKCLSLFPGLNLPPKPMSYQSGIHSKMAIFNPKSHPPETSERSENFSILLVRLFFICQATFTSFDILSSALAERGFRGGLDLVQIQQPGPFSSEDYIIPNMDRHCAPGSCDECNDSSKAGNLRT